MRSAPPTSASDHFTLGVLYVAAAGILYGTLVIFAKLAYATGIQPLPLLVLRYGLAAFFMWAVLAALRPDLLRVAPRHRARRFGLVAEGRDQELRPRSSRGTRACKRCGLRERFNTLNSEWQGF